MGSGNRTLISKSVPHHGIDTIPIDERRSKLRFAQIPGGMRIRILYRLTPDLPRWDYCWTYDFFLLFRDRGDFGIFGMDNRFDRECECSAGDGRFQGGFLGCRYVEDALFI